MPEPQANPKGGLPKWAIAAIVIFLALAALAAVAGSMVSWGVKRALEKNGVRVTQDGDTVTYATNEGTVNFQQSGDGNGSMQYQGNDGSAGSMQVGTDATLPEGFPGEFPVPAGAKVAAAWSAQQGNATGYNVTWTTGESTAEVKAFYARELVSAGWKITTTSAANDVDYVVFERGEGDDRDGGSISITRADEGTTTVSVVLGMSSGAAQ